MVTHDLRGPLSNLKGFCSELDCSIDQLVEAIDAYKDQLPEDFKKNINAIIDDDVKPCLRFSNSSIAKLGARLDQFDKTTASYFDTE